jgi:hypothetical protein
VAWDLSIDPITGDFVFGSIRDLVGVTGPELDAQRIRIRCRIPRGTFIHDKDKTLGSNLHLVTRNSANMEAARTYIQEALADADGISITDINMAIEEAGQMIADVSFTSTSSLDEDLDEGFESESDLPEFDARVPLGHLE